MKKIFTECDLELNTPFGVLRAKAVKISVCGDMIALESAAVFKHGIHTVVLAAQSGLEVDLSMLTTESIERIAEQKAASASEGEENHGKEGH